MSDWYIRTKAAEKHGPFKEQQIRKLLIDEGFAGQIQQGQSQWLDSELVRSKFESLDRSGIYFRTREQQFGPFTKARADVLKTNPIFLFVRQGKDGEWTPIERNEKTVGTIQNQKIQSQSVLDKAEGLKNKFIRNLFSDVSDSTPHNSSTAPSGTLRQSSPPELENEEPTNSVSVDTGSVLAESKIVRSSSTLQIGTGCCLGTLAFGCCGILLFIPIINIFSGIGFLMIPIVWPAVLAIVWWMNKNGKLDQPFLIGPCPHCANPVSVSAKLTGFNCGACTKRVMIQETHFVKP